MSQRPSIDELMADLGEQLRNARVRLRLDQAELAAHAGISRASVSRLERGEGGQLHTFIAVVRVIGKVDWLQLIAPTISVEPLLLLRTGKTSPQRVKRRKDETDSSHQPDLLRL